MKRFHVHLHVNDLAESIGFYARLFGSDPTRVESDYAKWMLDDPAVNFAISTRGHAAGIDHLGIQADNAATLAELKQRAAAADSQLRDEGETTCCYARSEKHWVTDPQGVAWEQFHTLAAIPIFSEGDPNAPGACCVPAAASTVAAAETADAPTAAAAAAQVAEGAASCCAPPARPRGKPLGIAVKPSSSCC